VAWRRLVAALVAAAGLACASATNYLDPGGPLHEFRRDGPPRGADLSGPLRAVSFNIAYAVHIDRALEVLRESEALRDPDVLALQEMDAPGTERIAKALGMNAVYFPSGVHPKHERDFGCAVLSPWAGSRCCWLSRCWSPCDRKSSRKGCPPQSSLIAYQPAAEVATRSLHRLSRRCYPSHT